PYNVEDLCAAMIRFDNGLTMSIEASFNLNIEGDVGDVQLFGTKAGTSVNTLRVLTTKDGKFITFTPEGEHSFRFGPAFSAEIKGFVDASNGKCECLAPAEDGVWLMKIIDAVYKSAKTGTSVEIK
ncbi:MAG: gfo/Idh/MocA family oxidoreductase, partial [Clostridia bacterium]|nr:gfo/Idh/MocA family oxidoreductase [Clostridia bacterium]